MSQRTDALISNFSDCFRGINNLLAAQLLQPCLVLVYSTIDAAASLERASPDADVTKTDFLRWVERYILGPGTLKCTALELYAARCGVVHCFSASSALSRQGQAREIGYAWGIGTAADLEDHLNLWRRTDIVAVQLETLIEALKAGFERFLDDVQNQPERLERVLKNSEKLFIHRPTLTFAGRDASQSRGADV